MGHARSRAFIHLFLKVRFGLTHFKEREQFLTDDPQDGGIDGYFLDEEHKTIYLIQSKFRSSEINFKEKEILFSELLQMDVDRVVDGGRNRRKRRSLQLEDQEDAKRYQSDSRHRKVEI